MLKLNDFCQHFDKKKNEFLERKKLNIKSSFNRAKPSKTKSNGAYESESVLNQLVCNVKMHGTTDGE